MKNISFLISFLLLSSCIFSQETPSTSTSPSTQGIYFDASGYFSIPLGAYKNSKNNDVSGFANPGFLAQLNLDWIGEHDYGLAFQYTLQYNPLNKAGKNDTIHDMSQPLGTKGWTNHYLTAGIVVMKETGKFTIEGKVLGGVVLSSSPVFRTIDPVSHNASDNTGIGFALGGGLSAGYAVTPRVKVKVSIEYLQGYPKIHKNGAQPVAVDSITGNFIYSAPVLVETKRVISSFNIGAGVLVKISK